MARETVRVKATKVHMIRKVGPHTWEPKLLNIPYRETNISMFSVGGQDLEFIREVGFFAEGRTDYAMITETDGGYVIVRHRGVGYRVFDSGMVECTGNHPVEDPELAKRLILVAREFVKEARSNGKAVGAR